MPIRNTIAPETQIMILMTTARFAFLFVPALAMITGTNLPMFIPSTIGAAIAKVILPAAEIACRTPTDADALCKTLTTTTPSRTPSSGFSNRAKISCSAAEVFSGSMPPSIIDMPINSVPKPIATDAIILCLCFFASRRINAPTATQSGANVAGERIDIAALPDKSPRRRI